MSQLFGFQINRKKELKGQSPVPPSADEPVAVAAGGYFWYLCRYGQQCQR